MILRYLQLYPAIIHYSFTHPEMKIPVISHKQYKVLQDLVSILSILHHAQELLSAERTPTLALALPVYESLIQALTDCTFKFPELTHAVECGIHKLEDYVSKTRDLPVYAFAMVINPCLKFNWIDQHWSQSQRQNARVVVKEKMLDFRQQQHKIMVSTRTGARTSAERAAQAQRAGYMRLLTLSSTIHRASELAINTSDSNIPSDNLLQSHRLAPLPLSSPPPPSEQEILVRHMAEVDAELLRWDELEGFDFETMGTLSLVDFWKTRRHEFPLLYRVALDILPVQASSVSSERAFSSSKMTCTRERNKISAESMEYLQVLKHSLHRRRLTHNNHQTLDFYTHIVGSESDDEHEDN